MSENTNPVKAIRAYCLDCCCNQANEVALCEKDDCALHPFRFGKNPYHKQVISEEERQRRAEHMKRVVASRRK